MVYLGLGGVFKYHILLVGGGLSVGLLWYRSVHLKKKLDLSFWLCTIALGAITTLPVWIWNYQNNFEGILFQTHHGFGDGGFDIKYLIRTVVALFVVMTPVVFISFFGLYLKALNLSQRILIVVI